MANGNEKAEGKVPDAMDPAVVAAKMKEIEQEISELEKRAGDLHAQAVMLGSDRMQIVVSVVGGRVLLSGSLYNMVDVLGILESGKVAFLEMRRQQDAARRAEQMAGMAKTPGGIHLPGGNPTPAPPWVKSGGKR